MKTKKEGQRKKKKKKRRKQQKRNWSSDTVSNLVIKPGKMHRGPARVSSCQISLLVTFLHKTVSGAWATFVVFSVRFLGVGCAEIICFLFVFLRCATFSAIFWRHSQCLLLRHWC